MLVFGGVFLFNPQIFCFCFNSFFSDHKEGDILLKTTKFSLPAILGITGRMQYHPPVAGLLWTLASAKQEMTPMIRNEAASSRNWGSFPQSLQNGLFSIKLKVYFHMDILIQTSGQAHQIKHHHNVDFVNDLFQKIYVSIHQMPNHWVSQLIWVFWRRELESTSNLLMTISNERSSYTSIWELIDDDTHTEWSPFL